MIGAPATTATLGVLSSALLMPSLRLAARIPSGAAVLAIVALLFVVSLAAGVSAGRQSRLLALGAAVALGAVAYDAVRGNVGTLTLRAGAGATSFEEEGPGGASVGLRPLGGEVVLESVEGDTAVLGVSGHSERVTPTRAAAVAGFRLGAPHVFFTGAPLRLRVEITSPRGTRSVELVPAEPATSGDLSLMIAEYYPDFALDENRKPFTRSDEPRNPAAVLHVKRGTKLWRVFVLQSMPGVHKQEDLEETFALSGVDAERGVDLRVSRQPAAAIAGLGLVLAGLGLVLGRRA